MRYNKNSNGTCGSLDVEIDEDGNVVAVWFRCMMLPFKTHIVSDTRAQSMKDSYAQNHLRDLVSIEVENAKT